MTTGSERPSPSLTMTAVICTRNRAGWTEQAVRSLLAQDIEPGRLEIIVVDNASTDDTAARIGALIDGEANARYVLEPVVGLSQARNRAVAESSGDVIAFLDDDAEAVAGWAEAHLQCFERNEAVAATGGRIILGWPSERPDWLPARCDGMYAGLERRPVEHDFEDGGIPYGANMAIRRKRLFGALAFHLAVGRQGEDLTSGEERALFDRLRADGGRIVYVPGAEVTHHVLPERVGRRWFFRRVYAQGRSAVLIHHYVRGKGSPPYWFARCVRQAGRSLRFALLTLVRLAMRRPPMVWTDSLVFAVMAAGVSRESARMFVRTTSRRR